MTATEIPPAGTWEYKDLGFGSVVGGPNEKRLLNRDRTFNPRLERMPFLVSPNAYHFFLTLSWKKFLVSVISGYLLANVIFALAYLACGADAIIGQERRGSVENSAAHSSSGSRGPPRESYSASEA